MVGTDVGVQEWLLVDAAAAVSLIRLLVVIVFHIAAKRDVGETSRAEDFSAEGEGERRYRFT